MLSFKGKSYVLPLQHDPGKGAAGTVLVRLMYYYFKNLFTLYLVGQIMILGFIYNSIRLLGEVSFSISCGLSLGPISSIIIGRNVLNFYHIIF